MCIPCREQQYSNKAISIKWKKRRIESAARSLCKVVVVSRLKMLLYTCEHKHIANTRTAQRRSRQLTRCHWHIHTHAQAHTHTHGSLLFNVSVNQAGTRQSIHHHNHRRHRNNATVFPAGQNWAAWARVCVCVYVWVGTLTPMVCAVAVDVPRIHAAICEHVVFD